ncbi:MAG: cell division protein ZapE [Coxiellaceae bacterium]|nr:MAG: cell division protein ZapE [Coxiellaceae bacterium]
MLAIYSEKRWHFVEFMAEIHRQLQALKGEPNPLNKIAQRLAQLYRVICLDEFIVIEIVDAMILARLLTALMANRCVMVLTSNVVPDALYKNGLQREQFLPAIALINKHFEIIELSLNNDYRQRNANLTYFLFAQNGHELLEMEQYFLQYSAGSITTTDPMIIAGRSMPIKT